MQIYSFFKFFGLNRYKLLVVLLISSMLFIQTEEKYIDKTQANGRMRLVNEHRYGKPFVYYVKQKKQPGEIKYEAIVYNLLVAYALTLVLHGLVLLAFLVFHASTLRSKGLALLIFVLILLLPYLLIYAFGQTLLNNAVVSRNYWQVRALMALKISPNRLTFDDLDFPLKEAAYNRDLEMTRYLLKRNADINMANKLGETALHIAVRENAINIAKELLQRGANVNARDKVGNSPLHYVNHLKLAKLLIEYKANPNLVNNRQQTPIFTIEDYKSKQYIIQSGGKVDSSDMRGNTALYYVRSPEEVTVLTKAGINVNHQNNDGQTVLHYLVPRDKFTALPWAPDVARKLLHYRANVDIVDSNNWSALHYAIKYCNPRAKFGATLELGRLFFRHSASAKAQYKTKKYSPTLQKLIDEDTDRCWQLISRSG